MIQNPRRNELSSIPFLNNALDLILAAWDALFGVEHDIDGHHTNITATSVTVTGAGSFGEAVTAGETVIGPITTDDGEAAGINLGTQWQVVEATEESPGAGSGKELQFWDLVNGGTAPAFRAVWSTDRWVLFHGQGQTAALQMGTSSRRIDELHVLTANVVTALNSFAGMTTFGRTVRDGFWLTQTYSDSNFTGNATGDGDWVVDSGDQLIRWSMPSGRTMTVSVAVATSDVANSPVQLSVVIPGGHTAANRMDTVARLTDAGGTPIPVLMFVAAAGTTINFAKFDGSAFTNTAGDNTVLRGVVTFETGED
jgi:hypothetical protein